MAPHTPSLQWWGRIRSRRAAIKPTPVKQCEMGDTQKLLIVNRTSRRLLKNMVKGSYLRAKKITCIEPNSVLWKDFFFQSWWYLDPPCERFFLSFCLSFFFCPWLKMMLGNMLKLHSLLSKFVNSAKLEVEEFFWILNYQRLFVQNCAFLSGQ